VDLMKELGREIAAGEKADAQLDSFITKRHDRRVAEEGERPAEAAMVAPARAPPIHLSAWRRETFPLASPLATSSKRSWIIVDIYHLLCLVLGAERQATHATKAS
jgi:hypothetical protein